MQRKSPEPKRRVGRPRAPGARTPDKFLLRLEPALLAKLEVLAKREHRSVNAQLITIIERAVGAGK